MRRVEPQQAHAWPSVIKFFPFSRTYFFLFPQAIFLLIEYKMFFIFA